MPLFAARAEETVAWLQREMLVDGAFASALDADSEGEEGRFYVWDAAEIDRLLGDDAPIFRLAYGVTDAGNWEGHNVLNRLHEPGLPPHGGGRSSWRDAAPTLLAARELRDPARPRRQGAGRLERPDDRGPRPGRRANSAGPIGCSWPSDAFAAVLRHMSEGDRLFHSWRAGRRLPMAFLDDYAQMSRAALGAVPADRRRPAISITPAPGSQRCRRGLPRRHGRRLLPQRRRGGWADRAAEERP